MRRLYALSILLFFIVLIGSSAPVRGESNPAVISCDQVSYDYERKIIRANGNVKITYKDISIEADRAFINHEENILLATGHVKVTKKDDVFRGDRFLYYLKERQGWLTPLDTRITDPEIKGEVLLAAHDAYLKNEEDIWLKDAFFTSCDLKKPHFHITAGAIEYFPEERIVFHRVWYWERNHRLFYLPYLAISLKEESDNFEFRVGQTAADGWFLYAGFNYFLRDDSYGKIYLNLTELSGDGVGIRHYFEEPTRRWYQELYIADKSDWGYPEPEYKYAFGYNSWKHPNGKVEMTLENWHRFDYNGTGYLETEYFYKYLGLSPRPNLFFHFQESGQETIRLIDLAGNWSYRPSSSLTISGNGRWYLQEYLTYDYEPLNNMKYRINVNKNWGWSYLTLTLDETNVYSGNIYSYNYRPDMAFVVPKMHLWLLGDLRLFTQYSNLEKFPTGDTGERRAADLQKTPFVLWKNKSGSTIVNSSYQLRHRELEINGASSGLDAFTTDIGARWRLTRILNTELRLGYTEMSGTPNSFFSSADYILPGGFLANNWQWQGAHLSGTASTGYNFYSDYAEPLNLNLRWNSGAKQNFFFHASYDWYDGLEQTDLQINYNPKENWKFALWLGYNFDYPAYPWTNKQFEAIVSGRLTAKWRYELATRFDLFINDFSVGQVNLIFDWHCRELVFHYDWIERQLWVQISFKAFPQAKLKLGTDPMEYLQ